MQAKTDHTKKELNPSDGTEEANLQGYPANPPGQDIYDKFLEEEEVNPEDISRVKESNEMGGPGINNEHPSDGSDPGSDLDVPGSELDDNEEAIGSEDEENNYYSLGGDDHTNLDEVQ